MCEDFSGQALRTQSLQLELLKRFNLITYAAVLRCAAWVQGLFSLCQLSFLTQVRSLTISFCCLCLCACLLSCRPISGKLMCDNGVACAHSRNADGSQPTALADLAQCWEPTKLRQTRRRRSCQPTQPELARQHGAAVPWAMAPPCHAVVCWARCP